MKLRIDVERFDVGAAKWKATCPDFQLVTGLGTTKAEARAHLLDSAEEMLVSRIKTAQRLLAVVWKAKRKPVGRGGKR